MEEGKDINRSKMLQCGGYCYAVFICSIVDIRIQIPQQYHQ